MNLTTLQRRVRECDMGREATRFLIQCRSECEIFDYKEALPLEHDKSLCDFAKDVVAIKNMGGGFLLIGVRDKTWEPVGLKYNLPYDTKSLRDKLRKSTGLELDIDIVPHEIPIDEEIRKFALIFVRGSLKRLRRRDPTIIAKDYCARESYGLHKGEIYVRWGDSTIKLETRDQLDETLRAYESQVNEAEIASAVGESPFVIEDGTYRLLEKGFERFIGRENFKKVILDAVMGDPRMWIINVHGPGGVGKTALVNWAVYELYGKRSFEAILHLSAKDTVLTEKGITPSRRSLYSLENLLDHILDLFQETPIQDLNLKKKMVEEIFRAWNLLLVLDNMETVQDGRILQFLQKPPVDSKVRVLLTSRQKTGGWEHSIGISELTEPETSEFASVKAKEMGVALPAASKFINELWQATGGLPLAIQWVLGRSKLTGGLGNVLAAVGRADSPILEFTFRHIWNVLSPDSKTLLAVLSIFDKPPSIQDICIATEWRIERVEAALIQLIEVTLVTKLTNASDGRVVYVSLPITLSFARNELGMMGDLEINCRRRFQQFTAQSELQEAEVRRFRSIFDRFGIDSDSEKRAAILCQRGQSEMFAGNEGNAASLFREARELAPRSAYVYAMNASFELARSRIGEAMRFAEEACARANRKTGTLAYTIKAAIFDKQHNKRGRVEALEKALEYDPGDVVIRHQYGVALSRAGREQDAIDQFTKIIDIEKQKVPLREMILFALKTRIMNLRWLKRPEEANQDLQFAQQVLKDNPHLQHQARHIVELEESAS